MDIEQARFNMVEQQIRPWDVLDPTVLDLLFSVKREDFVPAAYRSLAFVDMEIPLPGGETMLPPRVEARMLQELAPKADESALEIGTGSGYMAALLAHLAGRVTTVEILPELVTLARENLARNHVRNVKVEQGNAATGWQPTQRHHVICVTGSLPFVPDTLMGQLEVGGRMAVIVGEAPVMNCQLITRTSETGFTTRVVFETVVKPLTGALQPDRFRF